MSKGYAIYDGTEAGLNTVISLIKGAFAFSTSKRMRVEFREAENISTSQRGLYRVWLRALETHFQKLGRKETDEDFHDLMRYKFLGTEDLIVGKTKIMGQLRSTAEGKLGKQEMSEYMAKVEAWALECGVMLPMPADNDYLKYREANQ